MDQQEEVDQQEAKTEEPEVTYHAVEKDGEVTAIWEMQGRKHLRTIDPRSEEGRHLLGSHTTDEVTAEQEDQSAQSA